MALTITITDAGRAEIINAENTGTGPVVISEIGVGSGQYTPSATQTALSAEVKRIATIAGQAVADDTIHVTINDESNDAYDVGEFGLYSASGTLLAVYSQTAAEGWILEKAAPSTLLLAVDIVLESLNATNLTFGDTSFSNPQASETVKGVAEIATQAEADTGTDDTKIITPLKLNNVLEAAILIINEAIGQKLDLNGVAADSEKLGGVLPDKYARVDIAEYFAQAVQFRLGGQPAVTIGDDTVNTYAQLALKTDSAGDHAYIICYGSDNGSNKELAMKNNMVGGKLTYYVGGIKVLEMLKDQIQVLKEMKIVNHGAGDARLTIMSDTSNVNEADHPSVRLVQDGGVIDWRIGLGLNDDDSSAATNNDLILALVNGSSGKAKISPDGVNAYDIWHTGICQATISANGQQKLGNGLILKWGTTGSANGTHSFPTAFPNACLKVVGTPTTGGSSMAGLYINNVTKAGFNKTTAFDEGNPGAYPVGYFAIGY